MADTQPGAPNEAALDAELALARTAADPRRITQALRRRADGRIQLGRFPGALVEVDEAARIHADRGEVGEQARCLHLAATTARLAGDLDGAVVRARAAIDLCGDEGPVAVSAWTELGETAFARQANEEAGRCLELAVQRAEAAGMLPRFLAALHRRRGQAWAAAGQHVHAAACLQAGRILAEGAGEEPIALRLRIEEAGAWLNAGQLDHAALIIDDAGRMAGRLGDDAALADLELLRSTVALHRGHVADALAAARSARALALQAVHPVAYTAAAVAMGELCDALGDRVGAYEALAVGWVTLGDLLGPDAGKATFAPKLQEKVQRWGQDEFVRVRDAYEARRRAAQA